MKSLLGFTSVAIATLLLGAVPDVVTAQSPGWSWAQVAVGGVAPANRSGHAMAYDSQRGKTVLFGGYNGGSLGDTWEWDGATWQQVVPTGASPVSRRLHAMVYDSQRGRTVLFGGYNGALLGDTWEWDGTSRCVST